MVPPIPTLPPAPPEIVEKIVERVVVQKADVGDVMLGMFSALGFAVSARFLMFLALLGAFSLAVMAMMSQTVMAVVVLGVYCALIVLPLVMIEIRSKRKE